MTIIHTEPNEAVITELYAFLSTDETGEGIVGEMIDGAWTPLVTSKLRIAEKMRPLARHIAEVSGKPVRLVKFTARQEME
jgi:hypothetical protein